MFVNAGWLVHNVGCCGGAEVWVRKEGRPIDLAVQLKTMRYYSNQPQSTLNPALLRLRVHNIIWHSKIF